MAITLTSILSSTSMSTIINNIKSNFEKIVDYCNSIDNILNVSTSGLTVSSVVVEKGENSVDTEIVNVQASANFDRTVTTNKAQIDDTLDVDGVATFNQNVTISDESTSFTNNGRTISNGEINCASSQLVASDGASFDTVSGNVGTLQITNTKYILCDFSAYNNSDTDHDVVSLKLPNSQHNGQELKLIFKFGSSTGSHKLLPTVASSTANIYTLNSNGYIDLSLGSNSKDYKVVDLYWDSSRWVVVGLMNCTIVNP